MTLGTDLTDRELEVIRELANGATPKVAARNIGISHRTVEFHARHIRGKLGTFTTMHAVVTAVRLGIA